MNKPFTVLAPMDDITDTVFRQIVAQVAPADVAVTEFASADGFAHPKGRDSVERRLRVSDSEHSSGIPIVAQIWGSNPDHYELMARDLASRGDFAGIDINMGCPEKGIVKRGCCGGLIKPENWDNAAAIIAATKRGAGELPVSVKTRIGVNQIITEDWATHLLNQGIAVLTVHGRTVKEMSRVPAHWDEIGKVVELRNKLAPDTLIIGNGDIENRTQALEYAERFGVDGVMIGRGILRDIQAFGSDLNELEPTKRVELFINHLDLYEKTWGQTKPFDPMKKFAKLYISGFNGAAELRARLMETKTGDETRQILKIS